VKYDEKAMNGSGIRNECAVYRSCGDIYLRKKSKNPRLRSGYLWLLSKLTTWLLVMQSSIVKVSGKLNDDKWWRKRLLFGTWDNLYNTNDLDNVERNENHMPVMTFFAIYPQGHQVTDVHGTTITPFIWCPHIVWQVHHFNVNQTMSAAASDKYNIVRRISPSEILGLWISLLYA